MRRCSTCSRDNRLVVVRIASGKALWLSGKHFSCRNALEFVPVRSPEQG